MNKIEIEHLWGETQGDYLPLCGKVGILLMYMVGCSSTGMPPQGDWWTKEPIEIPEMTHRACDYKQVMEVDPWSLPDP